MLCPLMEFLAQPGVPQLACHLHLLVNRQHQPLVNSLLVAVTTPLICVFFTLFATVPWKPPPALTSLGAVLSQVPPLSSPALSVVPYLQAPPTRAPQAEDPPCFFPSSSHQLHKHPKVPTIPVLTSLLHAPGPGLQGKVFPLLPSLDKTFVTIASHKNKVMATTLPDLNIFCSNT